MLNDSNSPIHSSTAGHSKTGIYCSQHVPRYKQLRVKHEQQSNDCLARWKSSTSCQTIMASVQNHVLTAGGSATSPLAPLEAHCRVSQHQIFHRRPPTPSVTIRESGP